MVQGNGADSVGHCFMGGCGQYVQSIIGATEKRRATDCGAAVVRDIGTSE